MWRSIRAAIIGTIIGVIGGFTFIGYSTMNKIFNSNDYKENVINAINLTSVSELERQLKSLGYDEEDVLSLTGDSSNTIQSEDLLLEYENNDYANVISEQNIIQETTKTTGNTTTEGINNNKIIRLKIDYTGTEHLTSNETASLEAYVKQAVLYGIAEKLGSDYNTEDIAEVRRQLILSLEYINNCAEESAEEWGIDINSSSRFDYLYMPETTINGEIYEAGYYETLCLSLDDV